MLSTTPVMLAVAIIATHKLPTVLTMNPTMAPSGCGVVLKPIACRVSHYRLIPSRVRARCNGHRALGVSDRYRVLNQARGGSTDTKSWDLPLPVQRSSTALFSTTITADNVFNDAQAMLKTAAPSLDPAGSMLRPFPDGVYPSYRPLPVLVSIATVVLSYFLVILTGNQWQITRAVPPTLRPTVYAIFKFFLKWRLTYKSLIVVSWKVLLKTAALAAVVSMILQDTFRAPSRLAVDQLPYLPTNISHYESIPADTLLEGDEAINSTLNVHWIEYRNSEIDGDCPFDRLYVNHGFGASSLSWLPALPVLVNRLRIRHGGIGHDMCGFGLTDRRLSAASSQNQTSRAANGPPLELFTTDFSAKLGTFLLERMGSVSSTPFRSRSAAETTMPKQYILMGHSLGAITTLRMALLVDPSVAVRIVLVSPAFRAAISGPSSRPPSARSHSGRASSVVASARANHLAVQGSSLLRCARSVLFNALVVVPVSFTLKRIVGTPNFWKLALKKVVWGNGKDVSNSDALRFAWPSVIKGWERGLIDFTEAQFKSDFGQRSLFPVSATRNNHEGVDENDVELALLKRVLQRPRTTLHVIVGGADKIVSPKRLASFLLAVDKNIHVEVLPGLGHDAMEENVLLFVGTLSKCLQQPAV
jgi:pimeloyl-ACP methyl ester carboxylesterase